jgi:signal peptidase I
MPSINRKLIIEGSVILVFWIFAAYILIFTEIRWIPSGAMEPTLHGTPNQWEADKIIVDKLKYKFSQPQRGDIVVFSPT